MIKPIRTKQDHENALARIDEIFDAGPGDSAYDEMCVLVTLVQNYEAEKYPIRVPDLRTAIEFRLEQTNGTVRDLIPIFGTASRVSDVMSGKRDITMAMARALYERLGIPADVLMQRAVRFISSLEDLDAGRFPLKAMAKRGWILDVPDIKGRADDIIADLMHRAGEDSVIYNTIFYRKNDQRRINANTDPYALMAWRWQTLVLAKENPPIGEFRSDAMTLEFLRGIAQLSVEDDGPLQAGRRLAENGIALVTLRHLPRTHLDGAAFLASDGYPVVGLTLRHDRIDNFWFTLMHELAHVSLHMGESSYGFVDDLAIKSDGGLEKAADEYAEKCLIPEMDWHDSGINDDPRPVNVMRFASKMGIHPAIVAGRIRYKSGNYRLLSQFVGSGAIRRQFEESEGEKEFGYGLSD